MQMPLARAEDRFVDWHRGTEDVVAGLYYLPSNFFCEIQFSQLAVLELYISTEPIHLLHYAAPIELGDLLR